MRVWDVRTGRSVHLFQTDTHDGDGIKCVEFSPTNGNVLAAGDTDGTLWVWDLARRLLQHIPGRRTSHARGSRVAAPIYGIAFSPDGGWIAATGSYSPMPNQDAGLIHIHGRSSNDRRKRNELRNPSIDR